MSQKNDVLLQHMKTVYFDSAATTQLRKEVIDCMTDSLKNYFGNPSSTHAYGRSSKTLIESARKEIAALLNVTAGEIVFTSGGTEADNLAINSSVRDLGVTRIITSKIEHHAVLHTVNALVKQNNIKVDYVALNDCGHVILESLRTLLASSDDKTLVSLMHVNNEVGNILDIAGVGALCKEYDALFHSDTVQSVGHFKLDLQEINIDFLAVAAHKFHGPKGIGFAFVRKNSGLGPLIFGGSQERGLRAGTEPVHNILGMNEALQISYKNLEEEKAYIMGLKKHFKENIKEAIPGISFNGGCDDNDNSTYTLLNMCLPMSPEKGMMLLFQLDLKGIACSKGSACQSGATSGSHVLREFLSEEDLAKPSLRFSFSSFNTTEEIDYVVACLKELCEA